MQVRPVHLLWHFLHLTRVCVTLLHTQPYAHTWIGTFADLDKLCFEISCIAIVKKWIMMQRDVRVSSLFNLATHQMSLSAILVVLCSLIALACGQDDAILGCGGFVQASQELAKWVRCLMTFVAVNTSQMLSIAMMPSTFYNSFSSFLTNTFQSDDKENGFLQYQSQVGYIWWSFESNHRMCTERVLLLTNLRQRKVCSSVRGSTRMELW